jgi:hypothetical protein
MLNEDKKNRGIISGFQKLKQFLFYIQQYAVFVVGICYFFAFNFIGIILNLYKSTLKVRVT